MKSYFFTAILFFLNNGMECISYKKALDIGKRAYVYAYPLVTTSVTKDIMTANGKYVNQFTHITEFPDYTFKDIVRPNVDTLYSFAWLDLRKGPLILSVPDTKERYYLIEFLDAYTNVFAGLGKRTTGTESERFMVVGPDYRGEYSDGIEIIQAPTNLVLLLGRIQTNGKADYGFVRKIQRGFKLTPLKVSAKPAGMSFEHIQEPVKAPVDVVNGMDSEAFYRTFAQALKDNPPAECDAQLIADFKKISIIPGQDFDIKLLSNKTKRALSESITSAQKKIFDISQLGQRVNEWSIMRDLGDYGTNYLLRARIAYVGIGANLPEDAIYPTAFIDADGKQLNGKNKYVIHFDKNMLPPAHAFWSITMYNAQSFLIKNKLNRYALGDRDKLKFNKDGSLDIYIQHDSPGKSKESNWLPAPQDDFNLSMRIYWPKESVLNGTWNPPGIKKVF